VSASRTSTGSYVLTFDRAVTDCAVIGTVGGVEENVTVPPGVLSTENGFNSTGSHATVIVSTFSLQSDGGSLTHADENFHLALICSVAGLSRRQTRAQRTPGRRTRAPAARRP
jgi:hypothetical protein